MSKKFDEWKDREEKVGYIDAEREQAVEAYKQKLLEWVEEEREYVEKSEADSWVKSGWKGCLNDLENFIKEEK